MSQTRKRNSRKGPIAPVQANGSKPGDLAQLLAGGNIDMAIATLQSNLAALALLKEERERGQTPRPKLTPPEYTRVRGATIGAPPRKESKKAAPENEYPHKLLNEMENKLKQKEERVVILETELTAVLEEKEEIEEMMKEKDVKIEDLNLELKDVESMLQESEMELAQLLKLELEQQAQ